MATAEKQYKFSTMTAEKFDEQDMDKLCSYIEKEWEVDVELIKEVDNY